MFATGSLQHFDFWILWCESETLTANPATSKSPWATERHKTCSSKCWKERRITKPCPSAKSVCKDLGRLGFGSFWIPKSNRYYQISSFPSPPSMDAPIARWWTPFVIVGFCFLAAEWHPQWLYPFKLGRSGVFGSLLDDFSLVAPREWSVVSVFQVCVSYEFTVHFVPTICFQLMATVIALVFEETRSWFHSHHRIASGIRSWADDRNDEGGDAQICINFRWVSMVHCMEQTIRMVWGKPQKSFLDHGLLCRIIQEDAESHVCFWLTAVAPWSLKEPLVSKVRVVHQILCEVHPVLFAFRLIGC